MPVQLFNKFIYLFSFWYLAFHMENVRRCHFTNYQIFVQESHTKYPLTSEYFPCLFPDHYFIYILKNKIPKF